MTDETDYPDSLKPGVREKREQDVYLCKRCSAKWNAETGTRLDDQKRGPFHSLIPDCPRCRGEKYEYG